MCNIDQILRNNLTPEQYEAAMDPADEVLCLACAGSGKSRTLAYRIARLLAEGVPPQSIVAFTFTDKAAESIKQAVSRALSAAGIQPTVLGAMYIGTIHSYCQSILGEMDARYRQFDVLDKNRLVLYLMSRFRALGLQAYYGQGRRYFEIIKEVAAAWSVMNDELIEINAVRRDEPLLGERLAAIRDGLDRDHFIDFSSMIRLSVEALARGDAGALRATANLEHLMVDEYQDINPAQEALIQLLHAHSTSLFVVGDDDQAVYAFRGADVTNILTFADRYPHCSSHTLSQNFRSTPAIVEAANDFAAAELGAERIAKDPFADEPPGTRDFRKMWFGTRAEEAEWVADRVHALLGTSYTEQDGTVRGLTPADFAILMRSTRADERDGSQRHSAFTAALDARGITYSLEAGGGLFDRPQVQVLRTTFELLRNDSPDRQTVRQHFENEVLSAFPNADFNALVRVATDWGRRIHRPIEGPRRRVYPQEFVHDLLRAFRLAETALDDGTMRDLGVFSQLIQDVEAVYLSIDTAARFQEILNFLQNIAESGYDTSTADIERRPDAVTVSTVHKMKGLEFPVVIIADVEAQRFPGNRGQYSGWLPRNLVQPALARGAYQSSPSEEARLFYTAITRAERYLYVTGCQLLPGGRRNRTRSTYCLRLAHPEILVDNPGLPAGLTADVPRRRVDESTMPTTYSEIRYYLRCPYDYRLRKVFGFSPSISEMFGFGQTVHASICKLHETFQDERPTLEDAATVADEMFHLKHVAPSGDPENRPGAYEKGRDRAVEIISNYAEDYGEDFERRRYVEQRFEIPAEQAVIAGTIDLMLCEDAAGNIVGVDVVDFKTMEGGAEPEENDDLGWEELALQVQLYALASRDVLGENARTGAVHLLKDNQRIEVPITDEAIRAATSNVEWAVDRILQGDFPMRPQAGKCRKCDFGNLCAKQPDRFAIEQVPPPIHVPGAAGTQMVQAFSRFDPDYDGS